MTRSRQGIKMRTAREPMLPSLDMEELRRHNSSFIPEEQKEAIPSLPSVARAQRMRPRRLRSRRGVSGKLDESWLLTLLLLMLLQRTKRAKYTWRTPLKRAASRQGKRALPWRRYSFPTIGYRIIRAGPRDGAVQLFFDEHQRKVPSHWLRVLRTFLRQGDIKGKIERRK